MNINLPEKIYATAEPRLAFFEDLETRVRSLPRVQSAGFANRFPLRGGWGGSVQITTAHSQIDTDVDRQAVNPAYFETLGISLVRGRLLTPAIATARRMRPWSIRHLCDAFWRTKICWAAPFAAMPGRPGGALGHDCRRGE